MPAMDRSDMPDDHGGTAGMDEMPGMAMGEGAADDTLDLAGMAMAPAVWTPGYAGLMFFMWWIMMMAMMLPSAAPMILLFAVINRKQRDKGAPYVPTGSSPPAISWSGALSAWSRCLRNGAWSGAACCHRRWRAPACCSAPRC